jgi:hypothetical protein
MCLKALNDLKRVLLLSTEELDYPEFTYEQLQSLSHLTWHDFDILCWATVQDALKKHTISEVPSKDIASLMAIMSYKFHKRWDASKEEWVKE